MQRMRLWYVVDEYDAAVVYPEDELALLQFPSDC